MNNEFRAGFFTSSQASRVVASLKSGKPSGAFFTYIKEVAAERAMGRVNDTEVKTQPIKWGSLMEVVLFELLGIEYTMEHKKTLTHKIYSKFWSGTPDLIVDDEKVGEIKCFQPKNFSLLSMCLKKQDVAILREEFPKVYWQTVSNAALVGVTKGEVIAYMPKRKELLEILEQIDQSNFLERNGLNPEDYYFLSNMGIEGLAWLPDDSPMSSVNSFEFEVPQKDFDFLESRMIMAQAEVVKLLA